MNVMEPGAVLTAIFRTLCLVILTSLPTNAQDPGCQRVRISGSTSLQTHLMTTYTITEQTDFQRPRYISDARYYIYYGASSQQSNVPTWFVGQIGGPNGLYVEDSSDVANNIEGMFKIWDPDTHEWKDAPYVQITCADPGYFGCFDNSFIDIAETINMGLGITVESCIERCRNIRSSIAAVSLRNCLCGSGVNYYSRVSRHCSTPCGGDSGQICGQPIRADVYQTWVGACGYRETTGAIYSPKYPGTYQRNEDCTWEINLDPDKVIKFYYNVWEVPAGDRLVITDKSGQSRTLGPDIDILWTNEVTMNFQSDSSTQGDGKFAVQYIAMDHCGSIRTTGGIAQVLPSHGGNFAVGQRAAIRCTDGTETVVECLQNKVFNVTGPYCPGSTDRETTTAIMAMTNIYTAAADGHETGNSQTVVIAVVSALAVVVLLAVLGIAAFFIIRKRKAKSTKRQAPKYPRIHLDSPVVISSPTPYVAPTADVTPDVTLTSGHVTFIPAKATDPEEDAHAHYEETDVGLLEEDADVMARAREEELRQLYAKPMKKKKAPQDGSSNNDDPESQELVDNTLYGMPEGGEGINPNGGPSEGQSFLDNDLYGYS